VEGVWNERNNNIGLLKGLVEGSGIVDIKGNSLGVLEAGRERLGAFEGTAGYTGSSAGYKDEYYINWHIPTVTSTSALLRTSTVGLVTSIDQKLVFEA